MNLSLHSFTSGSLNSTTSPASQTVVWRSFAVTRAFLCVTSLLFAVLFSCSPSNAQTQVSISASKDNTLYEDAGGALSNGIGMHFFAGRTAQATGSIRRGLLAFDIAGNIPQGATIVSVTLTLNMSTTISGAQPVALHLVSADWGEGTSDASGSEGIGAFSTTGDATWLHTFFDASSWSAPGGDFSSTPSASQMVSGTGGYTWGSTDEVVIDVQQWLNSPSTNFGWLLLGNEDVLTTAKRFDTRENTTPGVQPRLDVTYLPPVSVKEQEGEPEGFALFQNYPNPFNPGTIIEFQVPSTTFVSLKVFDLLGREVATIVNEERLAGLNKATFEANGLAGGVYLLRLQTAGAVATRKILLLK